MLLKTSRFVYHQQNADAHSGSTKWAVRQVKGDRIGCARLESGDRLSFVAVASAAAGQDCNLR